jgi:hypothetical protein
MTDTKLIERLNGFRDYIPDAGEAADAIEALQSKLGDAIRSLANWQHQCTELQAKVDAMGKGEAVAYRAWFDADNGARWLFTLWPEEERLDVEWEPLYAAPKALAPLTDEQIYNVFAATVEDAEPFSELVGDPIWAEAVEITRAIEAAHGIHAKGVQQ